jgi:hypothetical protein
VWRDNRNVASFHIRGYVTSSKRSKAGDADFLANIDQGAQGIHPAPHGCNLPRLVKACVLYVNRHGVVGPYVGGTDWRLCVCGCTIVKLSSQSSASTSKSYAADGQSPVTHRQSTDPSNGSPQWHDNAGGAQLDRRRVPALLPYLQ